MTVAEAIDELVRLGLYRHGLRVKQSTTNEWMGESAGHGMTESWLLSGRLDRDRIKWSNENAFYFNERANTLDQLVERMRLVLGDKQPGDDAKAGA